MKPHPELWSWLLEGTAEYLAYQAIAREGLMPIDSACAQWRQTAQSTPTTLRALATLRVLRGVRA